MSLSVTINTKNAATTLAAAIKSVKKLADEVIVVDMNSTDDTVAVAEKAGAQVFHYRKDWGYADPARNFALAKAKHDWILVLDADEEIPETLASKIKAVVEEQSQADAVPISCYYIPRQNVIFGQWLAHTGWWPDYQPRLFRKGTVSWGVGVHRMPEITGEVKYFPEQVELAIVHQNYPTVTSYLQRLDRYTTIAAEEQLAEANGKAGASPSIVATFAHEFFQRCFAKAGIEDAHHGVSLSLLQAMYQVATELKKAELTEFAAFKRSPAVLIDDLEQFQKQLGYWVADWHVHHETGWKQLYWRIRRKLS